jgi:hypothetical protein
MHLRSRLGVIVCMAAMSGCAVMDPYVRSDKLTFINERETLGCQGRELASGDEALTKACQAIVLLEKSRSQVVRTRSGLTAALFPVAGIVGYNAARGINAPTNAALVAGGMAGYSATATLAQRDRVKVYENGIQAISCGIGLYEAALAEASDRSLERDLLRTKILTARLAIQSDGLSHVAGSEMANLMGRILDSAEKATQNSDPHGLAQRQLMAHVRDTINQVNAQLTLTVPTDSEAFDGVVGNLQGRESPAAADLSKAINVLGGLNSVLKLQDDTKAMVAVAQNTRLLALLEDILHDLEKLNSDSKPISISFSKCNYTAVADVGVVTASRKLMLGPGDASNGTTIDLAAGDEAKIRIYGGVPPFELVHTGDLAGMTAQIQGADGVSYVVLVGPKAVGEAEKIIDFTLSDAVGMQSKKFRVRIPPLSSKAPAQM